MHTLIDDILELSAIEAGNVPLRTEEIELHPLVNEVFASLAAAATTRQIVLQNRVDQHARSSPIAAGSNRC